MDDDGVEGKEYFHVGTTSLQFGDEDGDARPVEISAYRPRSINLHTRI